MRGGTRKRGTTWTWHLGVLDPATGRWRQLTKGGFRTKREAQAALNEAKAALRAGTFVESSRLTLGAFLIEQWLPTARAVVRPTTWTTYRIYAEAQVVPALGHIPLQALTAAHLNRLYSDLAHHGRRDGRGGLKPKSVRHVHVLLHKALSDAVRWGLVARNVADAADPPRVPRQERGAWSAEELRAFLAATSEDRLAAMWLLFATTGMRRGELLGLPWRAVNLEASPGRLAVVQTVVVIDQRPVVVAEAKTATSHRQIALDPFTVAALKAHRVRQLGERLAWGPAWVDTGLVFTHEDGQVLHPEHVTKRFARLVRDTGLPPITLHGVRHSYATAALAAGEPLKVVSERLGHASTSITANLYQHVLPSMDERTANAVANLILGGRKEDDESAVNPLSTGPSVHEPKEGGDARTPSSGGVSEGGLEPPRPMRALGPQPSASAYSATPTWCTWVRADCSKGAARGRGQAGRLTVARSRVSQGVRLTPWGPGVRTTAWCSVRRGAAGRSARTVASAWW
jgi:integrase